MCLLFYVELDFESFISGIPILYAVLKFCPTNRPINKLERTSPVIRDEFQIHIRDYTSRFDYSRWWPGEIEMRL